MVSAFLEVVNNCKAIEQASIHGSLGSGRSVSRSPCVEDTPHPSSNATLEHIRGIAVAVAYQHRLEEGVTDDRTCGWSNGRNLTAIAS